MNKQNRSEAKNPQMNIEDLTVNPEAAAEVKGGDHKQWINVESVSTPILRRS
ncbi:MAG: hypothetical protein AB1757_21680 [Acidobacteriota bacterium]